MPHLRMIAVLLLFPLVGFDIGKLVGEDLYSPGTASPF